MLNPSKLNWRGEDAYIDGTAYPDAQRRGYDLGFKRQDAPADAPYIPLLSVVAQADIQEAFISDLDVTQLENKVVYLVAVRDVTGTGATSAWSVPVEVEFDRVPNPPTLTVS
jgi:hypothetical protein